jgi:flagellar motor switch protein FliG
MPIDRGTHPAEHPQIVATILVHLDRDHAADILKCF